MQYDAAKVAAKTEVSECSERLRSGRQAVWRESLGPQEPQDFVKNAKR